MNAIVNAKLIYQDEIIEGKTILFDKSIVKIADNVNLDMASLQLRQVQLNIIDDAIRLNG